MEDNKDNYMNEIGIQIVQLDEDLPLPQYAHQGDGGIDLFATTDCALTPGNGRSLVGTGIAIAIPYGYAGFIVPRSGMANKSGITIVNSPGLIDSAYRGEIKVILMNTDPLHTYEVMRGDRIAQLVIKKVEQIKWDPVERLDEFDRGGGFGHSGR